MEQLPALGTAIKDVVMPTFQVFAPLLAANKAAIKSNTRETFTYGPHPRQALDVYYPTSSVESPAIFVFLYGGGLVRGDKTLPMMPDGLVHANVGHFIAESLSCIAVIPDYRLISHGAKFPSGGEDVDLVIKWVMERYGAVGGEAQELYIMGNSAGGIHLSTWLYSPVFEKTRAEVIGTDANVLRLRGVVMLSVPFHFRLSEGRGEVLETYYGDQVDEHSPLGLFKSLIKTGQSDHAIDTLGVKTLVLTGTLDPQDEILVPLEDYLQAWKQAPSEVQGSLRAEVMEGQNHISPVMSLGTAKKSEEAWGYQVLEWMLSTKLF